jgi:hypothetical protein
LCMVMIIRGQTDGVLSPSSLSRSWVVREGMLGRQLGGVELDLRRDRAFFAGRQLFVANAVEHVVRTIVAISLRSQMLYPVE